MVKYIIIIIYYYLFDFNSTSTENTNKATMKGKKHIEMFVVTPWNDYLQMSWGGSEKFFVNKTGP